MNNTWNDGYATDSDYLPYYFNELNPLQLKLFLLAKGIVPPKIINACELGFGKGLSINFHAVSSDVNWYGTDFIPSQVSFAKKLANYAQNDNVHLFDDSFAEFAARDDLPQFDYIALHGIWSWISDENKKIIVDFIRRKLNVGGILYISYNTFPGHNRTAPLRELLSVYAKNLAIPNTSITERVDKALDFAKNILSNSQFHCSQNPQVIAKLESLRKQDHTYLEHEYCNEHWSPVYFTEMAQWLKPAKLSFACSATAIENLDKINFNQTHNEILNSVNDPIIKELIKDFIINQQFRRDIWIKGPVYLNNAEKHEFLRELNCILIKPKNSIKMTTPGLLGEANFADIYEPILQVLGDNSFHSITEIAKATEEKNFKFNHMISGLIALFEQKALLISQNPSQEIISRCQKMNKQLLDQIILNPQIVELASPLTGGALSFDPVALTFIYAYTQLKKPITHKKLVTFAWDILSLKNHRIVKEGKILETDEENLEEIKKEALEFLENVLIYEKLQLF